MKEGQHELQKLAALIRHYFQENMYSMTREQVIQRAREVEFLNQHYIEQQIQIEIKKNELGLNLRVL